MKLVIVRADLTETNKWLQRIALALEAQSPVAPDTEITGVVIDEVLDSPKERDESEGLDELRKSY
jgi:hypothetical protein